jgi:hypothetical protein
MKKNKAKPLGAKLLKLHYKSKLIKKLLIVLP